MSTENSGLKDVIESILIAVAKFFDWLWEEDDK